MFRYSTKATSADPKWTLWRIKSGTEPARSVTAVSGTAGDECPTVWRQWHWDDPAFSNASIIKIYNLSQLY